MGLGKTVQALALLLARAKDGPALVVAPTSVCRTWQDEARRFAPTLTLHVLANAPDRAACIAGLGKGDVLLASYGLLGTCAEALGGRRFATAVFDEAHALKNAETRRAAGARSVVADAIVGLTGTPLENHLGELHSLFDVLTPGLLGTRERFERAFAAPIGRGDKRASAQLRALVRPFLLRRTKAQVLDELPEKTEVTRLIAPSDEERAFYEALRRRAVARVKDAATTKGGQARILVLAEITKLRRAAVDPRLVGGEEAPSGSKLEALGELVRELREEGHRALVFSQFLEVLDRARAKLEAEGARCVRLDGTMSADARAAAVDVFQSGQADVFLLSLRAGGVGMNLTAADYVVHLDPWWNPAVEDQATDRAHRIGQTRAVTVVRLVTEGTIEEKVLRLHAEKRALYADAIGGLEGASKVDLSEMVGLLDA
jgi:SNF2 family DNA or RNA helicase